MVNRRSGLFSVIRSAFLAVVVGFAGGALPALGADLEVSVTGLGSNQGDVHIALYDRPDAFPDSEGMVAELFTAVSGGVARARFADLEPGPYALAVYHDENANHEFDQGFLWLPLEDYGFSNGARALLRAPTFEAAAFPLPPEGAAITIDITR